MADGLRASTDLILAANAVDVDRAVAAGTAEGIVDRLTLTEARLADIADGPRARRRPARPGRRGRAWLDPAQRPGDPAGARAHGCRGDGLRGPPERHRRRRGLEPQERQRRTPARIVLGVRLEHRPGRRHARSAGGAPTCRWMPIQLVPGRSHEAVMALMTARGLVDLLIPRGRGRVDPQRRGQLDGPGDRDRRGQLPRVRRRLRRHRQGRRDPGQRQDAADQRVQHRRDVPRAQRGGRQVPARRAGGPGGEGRDDPRRPADGRSSPRPRGSTSSRSPTRTGRASTTPWTSPRGSSTPSTRPAPTSGAGRAGTPRRSSPRTSGPRGGSSGASTRRR